MARETTLVLYYIFAGIAGLFFIFWLIISVIPTLYMQLEIPEVLSIIFLNTYFFLMVGFGIVATIFDQLRKQAVKQERIVQQQTTQEQAITVNMPPTQGSSIPLNSIYCIRCGSKNLKYAKFCKICGATIE